MKSRYSAGQRRIKNVLSKILLVIVCLMLAPAGCKKSEPAAQEQVAADVNKALQTAGGYMAEARGQFRELQGRTQAFLVDLKNKNQAKWEAVKPEIEAKLATARQKLDEMRRAASENFEAAKKAFDDAIKDVNDTIEKTRKGATKRSTVSERRALA